MTPQYKVTDFIGTSPLGHLYLRDTSIQGTKILVHECWHFYLCICYLYKRDTSPGGALKGRLGRGVPPKPSKSPNPIENKSAVDRFVLLWQLTEIHWGKQLSEDLTTEEVATVLRFFFLVATSVTTATPGRWFCTMTSVKTWYARSPILIERLARHADILWDIHVCSRVLCKSKMHGKSPSVELITHF